MLRDVGRVLGLPFGQVDRVCKLVPLQPGQPGDPGAGAGARAAAGGGGARGPEQVARMIDIALQLEGLPRHASTHAAGVVIGDRPLDELVPLYRDPRADMPVDPVQHEGRREGGAGQVRLPRA